MRTLSYSTKQPAIGIGGSCPSGFSVDFGIDDPHGARYKIPHLTFNSTAEFPNLGDKDVLYIDRSTNSLYRWDVLDVKYYCVGSDMSVLAVVDCGNASNDVPADE